MIVLDTGSDEQTFSVIPRFEPSGSVTVTFKSEQQNEQVQSFTYAASYLNGYLTIAHTFDPVLKNNNKYLVEIKEGSTLAWRGKCFVTDQTDLPKYTINENIYSEPVQSNNEFVII